MRIVQYVEIELDRCSLSYGVGACPAVLGVDSDIKCFNSLKTCAVRTSFTNAPALVRFAVDTQALDPSIESIPSVTAISFSPATVSLGQDLGIRGSVSVTFRDHPYNDIGPIGDKYRSERPYDPIEQGTFWGKFRARYPFLRGRPLRLITGAAGQPLSNMETRLYLMDSFEGPRPDGTFQITAKDVLKLADDDRAQCPRLSEGFLVADITNSATTATLSPAGVGNAFYPASGAVAIGGEEICTFTRAGDVLTLVRGQHGTEPSAHTAQDRVQLCKLYTGQTPAFIIHDLLTNFAGIPSGYISLATWENEVDTFLQRLYTTVIAEPVGVHQLVSELIEQAALAIWWDDRQQQIRLRVIQPVQTGATVFDDTTILNGTFGHREQPEKRLTQVWVYYGQRNPLLPLDQINNFTSANLINDTQSASDNGSAGIKKVFSRWIPRFGRTVASRLAELLLNRFSTAPRMFTFSLLRQGSPAIGMGDGARIGGFTIQDDTGARYNAPIQVVKVTPGPATYSIQAEEMLATTIISDDLNNRVVIIDANTFNFNLRAAHDSIYPVITNPAGITVRCIVETGVVVGSTSTAAAFDVGSWAVGGIDIEIQLEAGAYIVGRGGAGGGYSGGSSWVFGRPGGLALYSRYPVSVVNAGTIGGGGGGGGYYRDRKIGGGGGAGAQPGPGGLSPQAEDDPAKVGSPGSLTTGGAGGVNPPNSAGAGGNLGQPGAQVTSGGIPGVAGVAIDGISYITYSGGGTVAGAQIN